MKNRRIRTEFCDVSVPDNDELTAGWLVSEALRQDSKLDSKLGSSTILCIKPRQVDFSEHLKDVFCNCLQFVNPLEINAAEEERLSEIQSFKSVILGLEQKVLEVQTNLTELKQKHASDIELQNNTLSELRDSYNCLSSAQESIATQMAYLQQMASKQSSFHSQFSDSFTQQLKSSENAMKSRLLSDQQAILSAVSEHIDSTFLTLSSSVMNEDTVSRIVQRELIKILSDNTSSGTSSGEVSENMENKINNDKISSNGHDTMTPPVDDSVTIDSKTDFIASDVNISPRSILKAKSAFDSNSSDNRLLSPNSKKSVHFSEINDVKLLFKDEFDEAVIEADPGSMDFKKQVIDQLVASGDEEQVLNLLWDACTEGDLEFVRLILEMLGKHLSNATNPSGFTPLHQACFSGNLDLVRYLVDDAHAVVNVKDSSDHGWTPLHVAAYQGFDLITEFLVKEGWIDVLAKDNTGLTAMECAYQQQKQVRANGTDQATVQRYERVVKFLGEQMNGI